MSQEATSASSSSSSGGGGGSSHLHREHVLSPITALAVFYYRGAEDGRSQAYILAGEDTDIAIYDADAEGPHARLCCGRLPVFRAQSIHGIAVAEPNRQQQVLVWGGYSVTVVSGELIESAIKAGAGSGSSSPAAATAEATKPSSATGRWEAKAPDWILDGRISPFAGDDDRIVLLTAHNELIEARICGGGGDGDGDGYQAVRRTLTFGKIRSPSRPILFSGNLSWISSDCVLVAAGTVFGEILVWKCYLGGTGASEATTTTTTDCEVLFVFSGHEGSIFGVHMSPELQTASGETIRLLASCSDDRTIRVWDITETNSEGSRGYDARILDARQTGFGDSVQALADDDNATRCLAIAMGHLSRIWQVEFPEEQQLFRTRDTIEIYSFGEDATAQKWHLEFQSQRLDSSTRPEVLSRGYVKPVATLTHQLTSSNHSGKHIWSHAIYTKQGKHRIATGGSDGKIVLVQNSSDTQPPEKDSSQADEHALDLSSVFLSSTNRTVSLTLSELTQVCPPQQAGGKTTEDVVNSLPTLHKPKKNARENFQCYTFITENRLLVVTNFARFFVGTFAIGGGELTWTQLSLPAAMSRSPFSYCVLESSKANSLAFIGTTTGDVYYYDDNTRNNSPSLEVLTKVHGKVADIFSLSDATSPVEQRLHRFPGGQDARNPGIFRAEILITVLGGTRAVVLQLDPNLLPSGIEVTLEQGFVVTAATFFQNYILLGSRNGVICVLGRDDDGGYSPKATVQVKFDDAITSIVPLPGRRGSHQAFPRYFLATCRDGKYRIYELWETAEHTVIGLNLLHEVAPRLGSVIEGAWFCGVDNNNGDGGAGEGGNRDLMLCGFRGKNMVVWNETRQQGIASIDCGGGHRSFAHTQIRNNPAGFRFVFTKASQMHVFSQTDAPQQTLKPGGHGREIKAASASGQYVATGAEDTAIRIWEYSDSTEGRKLRCVAVLEKHATGIQTLRWCGDKYLFSSAGGEEFYVWKINRIDSDVCPLGVVCEAVFPDRTEGGDLRIMDFDVERASPPSGENGADDAAVFRISMALSNSTLQSYTYTYDDARGGGLFHLCGRRSYTGACLTQLRHLGGSTAVLAAATDGHLTIFGSIRSAFSSSSTPNCLADQDGSKVEQGYREGDEARDVVVAKLHQNSIKSLDMRRVEIEADGGGGGTVAYLLVTGGDDNALGITTILRSNVNTNTDIGSGKPLVEGATRYEVKSKAIVRSAHAAAVTGVAILRLTNGGRDAIVVSTSSDQRVKTWRLTRWQRHQTRTGSGVDFCGGGGSDLKVALLDDQYSAVADSGDLEALNEDRVVVVGVGMEVWRMP
ncbi:WD repeat-containing protein 6 [Diatrype stigma]|uniref:WD repeat-containing protein 6 n=1 Tax=Diatrype stigma TaxID=117547 RepID=A0AAN9U423_9PEZI